MNGSQKQASAFVEDESLSIWTLSFAVGSILWIALFLGLGFGSEFGNQLTRIYGRDLQSANIDWWLFMAILVATSIFLHTVVWFGCGCVPINSFVRCCITIFVGGFGLFSLVLAICISIEAQLSRPLSVASLTLLACEIVCGRNLLLQSKRNNRMDAKGSIGRV